MSRRRTFGTSRPSLGAQVFVFFLHFPGRIGVQKMFGKRLEVPDILLPDIHEQPFFGGFSF